MSVHHLPLFVIFNCYSESKIFDQNNRGREMTGFYKKVLCSLKFVFSAWIPVIWNQTRSAPTVKYLWRIVPYSLLFSTSNRQLIISFSDFWTGQQLEMAKDKQKKWVFVIFRQVFINNFTTTKKIWLNFALICSRMFFDCEVCYSPHFTLFNSNTFEF